MKKNKSRVWTKRLNDIIQKKSDELNSPIRFSFDPMCVNDAFEKVAKELVQNGRKRK